jgi:RNA-splicing ligase RtcB
MLSEITSAMGGVILEHINSIHNYIDTENMILRKGAISAQEGETLVIPLNMRDGLLLCKGKGNDEWNCSAPHGAGRLYSRSKAKEIFTVEEYEREMSGIFSTCINTSTIDEAPFAYKDYEEIMECVEPTVEILDRLIPIFNFKASE